jgi:tetraacyldisaccharide 4'-kinase
MLKFLLKILSGFYYLGTSFRNFLYDNKILKSHEFFAPVISVGNLTVGGTGKTPHTEYIVNLLKDNFDITVLSRGYKRKSSGFYAADKNSTVAQIGDEPKQMAKKFLPEVQVAVCEDRKKGILNILKQKNNKPVIIVLDDAFQHRSVTPMVNILLVDYNRPTFEDHLLPYGRLRESSKGAARANIIIVTKCPDEIKPIDRNIFAKNMNRLPFQPVYFTNFKYLPPKKIFQEAQDIPVITQNTEILLVTGIANPSTMTEYIEKNLSKKITHIKFKDHHNFSKKDIQKITQTFQKLGEDKIIITTEKDAVRLEELTFQAEVKKSLYFLPVSINFMYKEQEEEFNKKILEYVAKDKTDYQLHTTVRQF